MRFDVVSIFPDVFEPAFRQGVVGRAVAAGLVSVNIFGGFLVTQRMLAMYKKKAK